MNKTEAQLPQTPWYKQFWPWALIGLPTSSIIFCTLFIYYAVTTRDTLVSDHYYKDGLAINEELNLEKEASNLGITANLYVKNNQPIVVKLNYEHPDKANILSYLNLKVSHATLAVKDFSTKLLPEASGAFSSTKSYNIKGHWFIEITPPDNSWRLKDEITLPTSKAILIKYRK
jgi:hypothetical protein